MNLNEKKVKREFESWVNQNINISTERYSTFPFSYKMPELEAMFVVWKGAKEKYGKV